MNERIKEARRLQILILERATPRCLQKTTCRNDSPLMWTQKAIDIYNNLPHWRQLMKRNLHAYFHLRDHQRNIERFAVMGGKD